MNDFINNLLKGKNVNPFIVIAAIVAVLIFRQCDGVNPDQPDQVDGVMIEQDTIWKDGFEKGIVQGELVLDSILNEIKLPEPKVITETIIDTVVQVVYETIIEHDTVEVIKEVEKIVYVPVEQRVFTYDSLYIGSNYEMKYQIVSYGRLKSFRHKMTIPESSIERIVTTKSISAPDSRNWLLLGEGLGVTDFKNINETEFYAGGSIIRTKKSISFGAGYLNQIGGNKHIAKVSFGVRF